MRNRRIGRILLVIVVGVGLLFLVGGGQPPR
jgi:hypothetical protein